MQCTKKQTSSYIITFDINLCLKLSSQCHLVESDSCATVNRSVHTSPHQVHGNTQICYIKLHKLRVFCNASSATRCPALHNGDRCRTAPEQPPHRNPEERRVLLRNLLNTTSVPQCQTPGSSANLPVSTAASPPRLQPPTPPTPLRTLPRPGAGGGTPAAGWPRPWLSVGPRPVAVGRKSAAGRCRCRCRCRSRAAAEEAP